MHGIGSDSSPLQACCQLPCVQHVGQFAVTVILEGSKGAGGWAAELSHAQAASTVCRGGDDDHTARGAALQALQQQSGQQEVAQVVHLERQAETILRRAPGAHSCVGSAWCGCWVWGSPCNAVLCCSPALLMRRCRWGSCCRKAVAKACTEWRLLRSRGMKSTSGFPVSCNGGGGRRGLQGMAMGWPKGGVCWGWPHLGVLEMHWEYGRRVTVGCAMWMHHTYQGRAKGGS